MPDINSINWGVIERLEPEQSNPRQTLMGEGADREGVLFRSTVGGVNLNALDLPRPNSIEENSESPQSDIRSLLLLSSLGTDRLDSRSGGIGRASRPNSIEENSVSPQSDSRPSLVQDPGVNYRLNRRIRVGERRPRNIGSTPRFVADVGRVGSTARRNLMVAFNQIGSISDD